MAVDAWKNFELTGKVTDYLAYRQSMETGETVDAGSAVFLEKGMGSYEVRRDSDGDGVRSHADWRV